MTLNQLGHGRLLEQQGTPALIAEILREAILQGVLQAGQPLKQHELAAQLEVSRIPLREALRQLEGEGLVTFFPNKGAIVSALSPDEVQEIYEIRTVLETMAIRLAIPNLTEATLRNAEQILHSIDQTSDAAQWAKLNRQFHHTLYSPANRPRLLNLIKMLHANYDRYFRLQLSVMKYLGQSQKEHYRLLDACRAAEMETAVKLLTNHINAAGQQLVHYLRG